MTKGGDMSTREPGDSSSQMHELTRAECMELLSSKKFGRIAWNGSHGPQVFPVNYTVVDGGVMIRTSPSSQIERLLYEPLAALQVDDVDEFLESGWSVLVVGPPEYVAHPGRHTPTDDAVPHPWAPGTHELYIRIGADEVTGRRIVSY
jgi:nitroimidazol reductase NimA-like FMN-containing flavoprotein (pyridoxamine 5'-phosphate oxidase superfamily)